MKASSFLGTGGALRPGITWGRDPKPGAYWDLGHMSPLGTTQEGGMVRAFSGSLGSWMQRRAPLIAWGPDLLLREARELSAPRGHTLSVQPSLTLEPYKGHSYHPGQS